VGLFFNLAEHVVIGGVGFEDDGGAFGLAPVRNHVDLVFLKRGLVGREHHTGPLLGRFLPRQEILHIFDDIRLDFIEIIQNFCALIIGLFQVFHAVIHHEKGCFLHAFFHGFGHGLANFIDFPQRCVHLGLEGLHIRFNLFTFLIRQGLERLTGHGFPILNGNGLVS